MTNLQSHANPRVEARSETGRHADSIGLGHRSPTASALVAERGFRLAGGRTPAGAQSGYASGPHDSRTSVAPDVRGYSCGGVGAKTRVSDGLVSFGLRDAADGRCTRGRLVCDHLLKDHSAGVAAGPQESHFTVRGSTEGRTAFGERRPLQHRPANIARGSGSANNRVSNNQALGVGQQGKDHQTSLSGCRLAGVETRPRFNFKRAFGAAVVGLAIASVIPNAALAKKRHHHRHHRVVPDGGTVIGGRPAGCPARFCGCGASLFLFGHIIPELNLAANWIRKFPRTPPAPMMAAARPGHVFVLLRQIEGNIWFVRDANSGGRKTREHARSISGYVIVNPHARFAEAQ